MKGKILKEGRKEGGKGTKGRKEGRKSTPVV